MVWDLLLRPACAGVSEGTPIKELPIFADKLQCDSLMELKSLKLVCLRIVISIPEERRWVQLRR
jgi:hypothetical protein